MKEIADLLVKRRLILRRFEELPINKRTLRVFSGVDLRGNYNLVFISFQKTKINKKTTSQLLEITQCLRNQLKINYKKLTYFYKKNIFSKEVDMIKKEGFRVYDFM